MADLTPQQLAAAAANLTRMRAWVTDLYPLCLEYEVAVLNALNSTKENGDWRNFIVNTFIDIAVAMADGAALAGGAPEAIPAIAALSAFLHDWGIGKDRPSDLNGINGFFAKYLFGHEKMQYSIEQRLSSLVDPANNYKNLTDAWTASIPFAGKTYTIGDLASGNFPGLGDKYNALQTAARREFHKGMWNLAIMKTCTWYTNWTLPLTLPKGNVSTYVPVSNWAQENLYKTNPGVFLRYSYDDTDSQENMFTLCYWNLGIGGNEFPAAACNQLFQDDTPGHIINPDGLFPRRYVFEQFHTLKPDFGDWRDLSNGEKGPAFAFTGGLFPSETVKSKVEALPLPKQKAATV